MSSGVTTKYITPIYWNQIYALVSDRNQLSLKFDNLFELFVIGCIKFRNSDRNIIILNNQITSVNAALRFDVLCYIW